MILGDYHTHTVFSHGKHKIEDNAAAAAEKGLKEIAITDHGLRHVAFGMKRNDIPEMRRIIDKTNNRLPEVRVLFGVEANLYTTEGDIDLKPADRECFDIILAGFHKAALAKKPKDWWLFYVCPMWQDRFGYTKQAIQRNTDAYVKAIKSGHCDVITHLNYGMKTDVKQVAQAAKDYGVCLELNGKRVSMTDEEVMTIVDVGAPIIVNSDAHSKDRVGDVSVPMSVVERLGIDKNIIVNWEKLPRFGRRAAR